VAARALASEPPNSIQFKDLIMHDPAMLVDSVSHPRFIPAHYSPQGEWIKLESPASRRPLALSVGLRLLSFGEISSLCLCRGIRW
jgi:hypothetical protein